ncbi:MAG: LTA synthase family protein, partial [Vallitaleaceae bacterium]|nr:LTA synthase family protein [Vallitaleaceae bacterium]
LKETYSSGYLTVPSIGAGTANTEFEVLTGMNLHYFGAGEYPYKTILQTTTCESIGYNLDALGYHSHAIHHNTGTFYDRNTVFQKLGFDSYSSIEYMNNIEYNPLGWAKDYILTSEILKEINASTARDLIYAISVQPHGKYPNKVVDENQEIQVNVDPNKKPPSDSEGEDRDFFEINLEQITTEQITTEEGSTEATTTEESSIDTTDLVESTTEEVALDESYKDGFEYYVNQLHETDEFIGELIAALKKSKEPTIVVIYGDHLPSMSFENEDLDNNNKFQTEYVLWSNYKMEPIKRDLNAYQLSAYVLERIGFDSGIMTKFHQRYVGEADYETELEMLQYDMLYGDLNAFGGTNPYIEKPIQMGVFEIKINGVVEKGEVTIVEGENFTPWSVVYVNEEPKETLFIDENTLMVPYEHFITESIYVAQVTDNNAILSQSKQWIPID